jgi:hypothetical protein
MLAATAHGEVSFHQNQPLTYDNGTSVTLPAGTYSTVEKISNVWYVNGAVFPSPTPSPTATPKAGLSITSIEMGGLLGVGGAIVVVLLLALYLKSGNKQETEATK